MSNIPYTFNPGISASIYLPVNEVYNQYTAFFTGLSTWSHDITDCVVNFVNFNDEIFVTFNLEELVTNCASITSISPIIWTLSSEKWNTQNTLIIPASVSESFVYNLKLKENGTDYGTASRYTNTPFTLNARLTSSVYDTQVTPITSENSVINETFNFLSIAPPHIVIDTPKQFVPINSVITIENLITQTDLVSSVIINLGNGTTLILSGSDVSNNFSTSYNTIGTKTISVTAFSTKWSDPFIMDFPNIVQTYSYNPGLTADRIYLPAKRNPGSPAFYTGTFFSALTSLVINTPLCYGKYGINWRWDTFKQQNVNSLYNILTSKCINSNGIDTFNNESFTTFNNDYLITQNCSEFVYPSSWNTLQCSTDSHFSKKWKREDTSNFLLFGEGVNPVSASPLTWTLSTSKWTIAFSSTSATQLTSSIFNYGFRLYDTGRTPYNLNYYQDTDVTLNTLLSVTYVDVTTWPYKNKTTVVNETYNFTSIAPPALSVVPTEHVIQTDTTVTFKNYITHTNFITSLKIDFDGILTELQGASISQDFTLPFNGQGTKNISLTAFTEHWCPIVGYFPRIVKVYTFEPGVNEIVCLPPFGSPQTAGTEGDPEEFVAFFRGLTGEVPSVIPNCFDKYGLDWKWNTFTSNNVKNLSSSQTVYPSSWNTVGSTLYSTYSKKWKKEGALYFDLFKPDFNPFYFTPINWTLSTLKWPFSNTSVIPASVSEDFIYNLRIKDNGEEFGTVSYYDDTDLTLNAYLSVTYVDTTVVPFDYKVYLVNNTFDFITLAPPDIKIYIPNKYVLTGMDVKFENLITRTHIITGLGVGFDDGLNIFLTGDKINENFSIVYDIIGSKTITLSAYTGKCGVVITSFPNVIKVLAEYDVVEPLEYRSISSPIQLPWRNQPKVGSNDWAVEDNINVCFKQFYENLEYLDALSKLYKNSYKEYYGYMGPDPEILSLTGDNAFIPKWTWFDADCFNTQLEYNITWKSVLTADNVLDQGGLINYGKWMDHEKDVITDSSLSAEDVCGDINWNVNVPKINEYYDLYQNVKTKERCIYQGVVSNDNDLFAATKTEVRYIPDSKALDFYDSRTKFDDVLNFSDIKGICQDSEGKVFILDGLLSQVAVYNYIPDAIGNKWYLISNWGGFGSENSKNKYLNPNDIHVDKYDTLWVVDTGNKCCKHYSNTGTWLLKTIKTETKPLSLSVDSQDNIHVLAEENIQVFSYGGEFLFSYDYWMFTTSTEVRKIVPSKNKEIIYIVFENSVLKFFRNGVFAGTIISTNDDINNITSVFHDEYRNLLVTTDNKILKYVDLMEKVQIKGPIPEEFWNLKDLYIHKNEYIQNWVYTKAFQRMWDNIEFFRNTLYYSYENDSTEICKKYKAPIYSKNQMIIGQNEIVTSTVVNRVLGYLWENFSSIVDFFDPYCSS
jgi:hypothetical protein